MQSHRTLCYVINKWSSFTIYIYIRCSFRKQIKVAKIRKWGKVTENQENQIFLLKARNGHPITLPLKDRLQLKSWDFGVNKMSINRKMSKILKKILQIRVQK